MKVIRVSDYIHEKLKGLAIAEKRTINAQAETILMDALTGTPVQNASQSEIKKHPDDFGVVTVYPAPEEPDVSDLFPEGISSNVRPDVQKIASEPSAPRSRGDVLADIRKLEAERDEELRYCQDAGVRNELALKWMKKIQPLWDEYNNLKEADNG